MSLGSPNGKKVKNAPPVLEPRDELVAVELDVHERAHDLDRLDHGHRVLLT